MSDLEQHQARAFKWAFEVFQDDTVKDVRERALRFLEEALELAQAAGMPRDQVTLLADYVYARPTGETRQEIGGVMVTLLVLASALGASVNECVWRELNRVETPEIREKVRVRQQEKREALLTHDARPDDETLAFVALGAKLRESVRAMDPTEGAILLLTIGTYMAQENNLDPVRAVGRLAKVCAKPPSNGEADG